MTPEAAVDASSNLRVVPGQHANPLPDLNPRPSLCDSFCHIIVPALLMFLALSLLLVAIPGRANVYPTNIKINGDFTNVTANAGSSVSISYILNEPASAGVTIKVFSTTNATQILRTISVAAGAPGTLRGSNTVLWDGRGNDLSPVPAGTYALSITAASKGYPVWTQTTDDGTNGNNVFNARGIAVDQNTNSPYYGRVFVANAQDSDPFGNNWLGYQLGILKCNADASYADEGGISTGGYPWAGDTLSPWHLEVSTEDFVYVDDFTTNGAVFRWDPTFSTNSYQRVLRPDNWTNLNVSLSGPALSGSGANKALWMADATFTKGTTPGVGILRYDLSFGGACQPNDKGATAVAVGGSLTGNPVDVALDAAGNIYTIQGNDEPGDPNNRVYRFPSYNPASHTPLTNADWAVGALDDTMAGANGIAVDPTGTYVAVAFTGLSTGNNGCTQIYYATNGAVVTNLDLNLLIGAFSDHEDQDCAWDAVGNVYYIDNIASVWRAVSPPGTNQSTTFALPTIQIVATVPTVPPTFTTASFSGTSVTLTFNAGTNDSASAFTLLSSSTANGTYTPAANAIITQLSPGVFQAVVPTTGPTQFYRIRR